MKQRNRRFWMVYGDGQRGATFKHRSKEEAEREAQRLAQAMPGTRFFVLKTVSGFEASPPSIHPIKIIGNDTISSTGDDIPF